MATRNKVVRTCIQCGKVFTTHANNAKYCGADCRKIGRKIKIAINNQTPEQLVAYRREVQKKKHSKFVDINKLAKEKGLSYGEYVGLYLDK